MEKTSEFLHFMEKIKEPILILDNYSNKNVYECLIFGVATYLRTTPFKLAHLFKEKIKLKNELSEESFAIGLISNLIDLIHSPKNKTFDNHGLILDNFTMLFQENIEIIKHRKLKLNDIINKIDMHDEDSFVYKKELQSLLHESSAIFYFWYLLHQNEENKTNPKYNFFDIQKSNKMMPNLKPGFKLQNFDEVQRTEDSAVFFVLSMIINFDEVEEEDFESKFNLIGIYQENNQLKCYRYELKRSLDISNFKFFDAVEMLAN